jgi:hypothetical protein
VAVSEDRERGLPHGIRLDAVAWAEYHGSQRRSLSELSDAALGRLAEAVRQEQARRARERAERLLPGREC